MFAVGTANRFASMCEETGDPLTDEVKASKGKENKQQAGKKTAAAAAPVPQTASSSKGAKSSAAAPGASAVPSSRTNAKQAAVPAAAAKQRDAANPADPKSRPPLREPRAPRAPRDATQTDWSGPQSQKDVEERKNRRNRENQDRGPLVANNFSAPDNAGSDERGPRGPRVSGGLRRDRPARPMGERGRGPRADNRDGRGKPVYDRHSGSEKSGVKAVEKRDGAGAHNWGTMNDEIAAQGDADETQKTENEAPPPVENQDNQPTTGEAEQVKEPEEEAPKELTLAEWKALSQRRSQPKYNIRKPNEGVDGAQFKKTYLLQKKKEEDESEYEEIEVITEAKESKKKLLDIEINFNEPFRGGDDRRGGRGGGRGGRGGGGFRGDAGGRGGGGIGGDDRRKRPPVGPGPGSRKQTAPKVDDVNDFPSLGVAA